MWTYEKYRFNGFFNQRIPSSKHETKEESNRCREIDLSCGIDCGELKFVKELFMLFLDERVGCVAVYENDFKINCMDELSTVKKTHFYECGEYNGSCWEVDKKTINEARELYKKLQHTTANKRD